MKIAIVTLSLSLALALPAWCAAPVEDELTKAIQDAKILPTGYSVATRITGKEAVVSTFRAPDTNATDCKIDASLIAKAVMIDHDFGITRLRMQFHEPAGTASVYQQVSVSLAEVKGFAAGVVTKEQFLDSLEIERLPEAEVPKPAAKVEEKKVETSAPQAVSVEKPKEPAKQRVVSKRIGISFDLPADWEAIELSTGPTILKLKPKNSKLAGIEVSYDATRETPQQRAKGKRDEYNYQGVSMVRYFSSTNFGTGPYPGSLVVLTYPHESNVPYYDMSLFFGAYKVWAWCDTRSYGTAGPAFDGIVRTLTFPTTAKKKKS